MRTTRAAKARQYFRADRAGIVNDANKIDTSFVGEHCEDRRVTNAITTMRQRIYDRCDIAEIANWVGISRRKLARRFERHLRVFPAEYCRDVRLNSARWKFLNTDRSVTQIAQDCRGADSSHLIRWSWKAV